MADKSSIGDYGSYYYQVIGGSCNCRSTAGCSICRPKVAETTWTTFIPNYVVNSKTCDGCNHHRGYHKNNCAWKECGCPWFIEVEN